MHGMDVCMLHLSWHLHLLVGYIGRERDVLSVVWQVDKSGL
jgi:hypothetical protein